MYKILDADGNVLAQVDEPRYVRLKESTGAWVRCPAALAECVAINGVRYSLPNRELVDDAPKVAFITSLDGANELYNTSKTTNANTRSVNNLGWALQQMAVEIVEMFSYDEAVDDDSN